MLENVKEAIQSMKTQKKTRRRAYAALTALALVASVATMYSLSRPGIAMAGDTVCGLEEHTHGDGCYTVKMVCTPEDHADTAQPAAHQHGEGCYEEQQVLTCQKEVAPGHVHTEACTAQSCELEESEGHSHGEGCYEVQKKLTCTLEETPETAPEPVHHTESCYERVLTCTLAEHVHNSTCYKVEEEVPDNSICGQKEHTHGADCTNEAGILICGLEEHTHEAGCYPEEKILLLPEGAKVPDGFDCRYTYVAEDESFGVAVYAPQGAVPDGAKLVAEVLAENSKDYIAAGEALDAMAEEEQTAPEAGDKAYDGFVALDIRFVNEKGKEVEPKTAVYVCINAMGLLPEEADPDSVSVQHLAEEKNGALNLFTKPEDVVAETVADAAQDTGIVEVTDSDETAAQDVISAFVVDSFSTFTIQWNNNSGRTVVVHYVDTNGNEIQGSQTNTVNMSNGNWVTLKDYNTLNGTIASGYTYLNARVDSPQGAEATSIRNNSGNWYYRTSIIGNGTAWNTATKEVYLVYRSTRVATVDTISQGVTINLHNYSNNGSLTGGINSGKDFKFVGNPSWSYSGLGGYESGVAYNNWKNGQGRVTGIVASNLVNGYPVLAVGSKHQSLDYLFDSSTSAYKKNYPNANYLFYMENGYFTYDSKYYSATLGENNVFTVASADNPGLWPFGKPSQKVGVDGYHYGMTVETDFIMPKNGVVNGKDMIFTFSGDDDVWVFLDGKLALDIGGIHGAESGTINFATGMISYSDGKSENLWTKLGVSRWEPYTRHELKFYYLERGGNVSNCKIQFNLPTVPKNSLMVGKELVQGSKVNQAITAYVADRLNYTFQVLKVDGSGRVTGNSMFADGTVFSIINSDTLDKVGSGTVQNGSLTLKAGQVAVFAQALSADGSRYIVREILPTDHVGQYEGVGYQVVGAGGTSAEMEGKVTTGNKAFTNFDTPVQTPMTETARIQFNNKVDMTKLSLLTVTKQVRAGSSMPADTEYEILIKLNGAPLAAGTKYRITGTNAPAGEQTVGSDGKIRIKDGQTIALLDGILVGTNYEVTEVNAANYRVTYRGTVTYRDEKGSEVADAAALSTLEGKAAGTIQHTGSVVQLQILNADFDFAAELALSKTLIGANQGEKKPFDFSVVQVDGTTHGRLTSGTAGIPVGTTITVNGAAETTGTIYIAYRNGVANGTYYYKVSENVPADTDGIRYDSSYYIVAVRVENNAVASTSIRKFTQQGVAAEGTRLAFVNARGSDLSLQKVVNRTDGAEPNEGITYRFRVDIPDTGLASFAVTYGGVEQPHADGTLTVMTDQATGGKYLELELYHREQATIKLLPAGEATITELTTDGYAVAWSVDEGQPTTGSGVTVNIGADKAVVCTNTTGVELPATGGIGTVPFTTAGILMMFGAGALLVLQRRRREA